MAAKSKADEDAKAKLPAAAPVALEKEAVQKYPLGITEEAPVQDKKKTIKKTIVNLGGTVDIFQVVTYSWGGVFYFKNEVSITQTLYEQELKSARSKEVK